MNIATRIYKKYQTDGLRVIASSAFKYCLINIIMWPEKVIDKSYGIQSQILSKNARSVAKIVHYYMKLFTESPRVDVSKIEGGAKGTIIYVGENDPVKITLMRTVFPNGYQEKDMGQVSLWQLSAKKNNWLNNADIVICRVNRMFPWRINAPYAFDNPHKVQQVLTLDKSLEDLLVGKDKRFRQKIRKMQEANITIKSSHSWSDFDYFYHRIYVPTVKNRFGERAELSSYQLLKHYMNLGYLMFFMLNDQVVGGSLSYMQNKIFYCGFSGLLDGNQDLIKQGLGTAFYWHSIQWAIRQKARQINFMGSNAWQSDGVFYAKQQWGSKVTDEPWVYKKFLFRINHLSDNWRDHLNDIGFLISVKGRYLRVYIEKPDQPYTLDEIESKKAKALKSGLDGIQVVAMGYRRTFMSE